MEEPENVIYESAPFVHEEEISTSYYILPNQDSGESSNNQIVENDVIESEISVKFPIDEECPSTDTAKEESPSTDTAKEESPSTDTAIEDCSADLNTNIASESSINNSANADPIFAVSENANDQESNHKKSADNLTCEYCQKTFTRRTNKQRHVRGVHKVARGNVGYIKCIECDINFNHIFRLRDHLSLVHNLNMKEEELSFPNINAFKRWKCEMERKTLCSYTLRHGARKSVGGHRYFYQCHRSGKYAPKVRGPRQRMIKSQGSCKMGISCTATIQCQETPREFIVRYCPHHYGHGKETTYIKLTPEERAAIEEINLEKGVPYENLLDNIRESHASKDHFQLFLLKKRDIRSINKAYACEEFNNEISDAESVDRWVSLCCQMENSPILFYQKEEFVDEEGNQEEFLLIIMTEFQKHILLNSTRNVVCVDSLYRKKGGRFYLTVLFIMDEMNLAFPVAFCISNKVNKYVIVQFFSSIQQQTGPLSAQYFMSDSENFYYESWKEVMKDDSKWLWSLWYVDGKIRIQMRIFKGNTERRAEVYKVMRVLLECPNKEVFTCMFENFIKQLLSNPTSKDLGTFIQQKYGSNPEIWASCYRKDIELATIIHLEIMHRTFRYCCREGRKKRLDKFIYVLMKLVRDKMLDRLCTVLDEEKNTLAVEAINICHTLGMEILPEYITAISDQIWLVRSEHSDENVYVRLDESTCPEHCNLKCIECDICVHMYSCTCLSNLINANLCPHIHAVVWNFITPHFSPSPSDPEDIIDEVSHDVDLMTGDLMSQPKNYCTELFQSVLKRTHQVYKLVQANKCNLSNGSLELLMEKMNECFDICSGKVKVNEVPGKSNLTSNTTSSTNSNANSKTVLLLHPYAGNAGMSQTTNVMTSNPGTQYVLLLPKTPSSS